MVKICWATTDSTSRSMRLNSSKHDQAPQDARPWNKIAKEHLVIPSAWMKKRIIKAWSTVFQQNRKLSFTMFRQVLFQGTQAYSHTIFVLPLYLCNLFYWSCAWYPILLQSFHVILHIYFKLSSFNEDPPAKQHLLSCLWSRVWY